jgi:hypothetical protein
MKTESLDWPWVDSGTMVSMAHAIITKKVAGNTEWTGLNIYFS